MEKEKIPFWRNAKVKLVTTFIRRLMETFVASIIPSFICVALIYIKPSDNAWIILTIGAAVVFALFNWLCWMRFKVKYDSVKYFYTVNLIIYGIFFLTSILLFFYGGYLVYSISFAGLRVLEPLGIRTLYSVIIMNCIMLMLMVICERFCAKNIITLRQLLLKNHGDKAEIEDKSANAVPMQRDKVVKAMSVDEADKLEEQDRDEALNAVQELADSMPESVVDMNISKGRGENINFVEIDDIDNDITDGDFNAHDEAMREFNENKQYSGDALWNSAIYNGRTDDNKPVPELDEEDYFSKFTDEQQIISDDDDETEIWDKNVYQGRDSKNKVDTSEISVDDEETHEKPIDMTEYDSDGLWGSGFYQGKNKGVMPERVMDYDDEEAERTVNYSDQYGSDRLWDNIGNPNFIDDEPEQETNPNVEYDTDSLWSSEVYQGRKK